MKIKTEFTLFASVLIIIVILGVSIFLFLFEKQFLIEEIKKGESSSIENFAQLCKEALITDDEILLLNYINVIKKTNEAIVYGFYLDDNDRILTSTKNKLIKNVLKSSAGRKAKKTKKFLRQVYTNPLNGELLDIVSIPVIVSQKKTGIAQIGFSRRVINKRIKEIVDKTRERILQVALVSLVVGIIGAFLLSRKITLPIRKLAQGAKTIGDGNLDTKIVIKTKNELGSLAGEFNRMAEKLKELDRMKKDFVSSVSHELRSPLTAIQGYLDLFINTPPEKMNEERRIKALNIMKSDTTRLTRFINDVLDLAKIEAAQLEVVKEQVNIAQIVEEIFILFTPLTEEKQIKTTMDISPDIKPILADSDKIKQVITNLVSNAFKFTLSGGRITIFAKDKGDSLQISVQDTGAGIPPDAVNYVFDKFRQVRKASGGSGQPKGTGLGLAIVKGIVEAHGGKIWVESQLNRGSIFHFTLLKK
ncbi:HAMP domain-containing histidine kinase [bacterium]|nr:HAMP domain-containing histidine kinase [bacterium]